MVVILTVLVSLLAIAAATTTFPLPHISEASAFISCAASMISLAAMGVNLAILSLNYGKEIQSKGRTVVLPDGTVIVGEKPCLEQSVTTEDLEETEELKSNDLHLTTSEEEDSEDDSEEESDQESEED